MILTESPGLLNSYTAGVRAYAALIVLCKTIDLVAESGESLGQRAWRLGCEQDEGRTIAPLDLIHSAFFPAFFAFAHRAFAANDSFLFTSAVIRRFLPSGLPDAVMRMLRLPRSAEMA